MAIVAGQDANASDFDFLIGIILPYGGSTAPTNWQICDGSAISRTTYSDLFDVIGTTFGVGDGSTTFNIPDMRGNFPLGKDNMGSGSRNRVTDTEADTLGDEAGSQTHTLTTAELPAHTHTTHNHAGGGGGSGAGSDDVSGTTASGSTGSGDAHENMPPYMTLLYIIKVTA